MKRERDGVAAAIGVGVLGAALGVRSVHPSRVSQLPPGTRLLDIAGRETWTHVPVGASRRVVLYLHGHGGKVSTLGPALESTFERVEGRPVVLMPQLGPKSEPGTLGDRDGVRALLTAFYRLMGVVPETSTIEVLAHSGGYKAAAATLVRGGIAVRGVGLLDALYGESETFEIFAAYAIGAHFANVANNAPGSETLPLSRALETRLRAEMAPADFTRRVSMVETDITHNAIPWAFVVPMLEGFADV